MRHHTKDPIKKAQHIAAREHKVWQEKWGTNREFPWYYKEALEEVLEEQIGRDNYLKATNEKI